MKISKEELVAKINDLELDDTKKIELMEDVTDSMVEPDTTELDTLKTKYEELQNNYKERFLSGDKITKEEKEEELEEKKYIDVKEI
jgi:hypothetical protein